MLALSPRGILRGRPESSNYINCILENESAFKGAKKKSSNMVFFNISVAFKSV